MTRFDFRVMALPLALGLAGCGGLPGTPTSSVPCIDATSPGAFVRGRADAPAAWLGGDGSDATPLAAADLILADATGTPIPGLPRQVTDERGAYAVVRVPAGFAYWLIARGRKSDGSEVTLSTLAKPGTDTGAETELSVASTLLSTALLSGHTGLVGDFDQATFKQAEARIETHLVSEGIPPSTDDAATLVARWSASDPELQSAVGVLTTQVASPAKTPAELAATAGQARDPDPLDALKPIY